ncbi:replication initiator protein [Microviridae sp.]|nr:replication initiator protein [Microviridae sp.]
MQRLRNSRRGKRIRFMACGEYGEAGRPHYHGILFNVSFHRDSYPVRGDQDASARSVELESLWGKGRTELAPVSYATAAYVAGYVVKKAYDDANIIRPHDREAYTYVRNPDRISWREAKPEFNSVSRNPGIGRRWIERNLNEVYEHDAVFIDGQRHQPPKFYDKVLQEFRPDHWVEIQRRRGEHASENGLSSGKELAARKNLFESKLGQRSQSL